MATRDGLVVVSCDQLSVLDRWTLFASTGDTNFTIVEAPPGRRKAQPTTKVVFDAVEIVREFWRSNAPSGSIRDRLQDMAGALQERFEDGFRWEPKSDWPTTSDAPGNVLFQTTFVRYNPAARAFECVSVRFHYKKEPKPMIGFTAVTEPDEAYAEAAPLMLGSASPLADLRSTISARSKSEPNRDIGRLAAFLADPPLVSVTSAADALRVAQPLLGTACERCRGAATPAGEQPAAMLISPLEGVKELSPPVRE